MLGVTVAIGVGVCKPWEPGRRGTGMGGQEEAGLQLFCRGTPPPPWPQKGGQPPAPAEPGRRDPVPLQTTPTARDWWQGADLL